MAGVVVSEVLNVTLFDTGDSILLSGTEREDVELVIKELVQLGATLVRKPQEVGSNWTASCRRAELASNVEVEKLGQRSFLRGRTLKAVRAKVADLTDRGARLEGKIENIDEYFIAICHDAPMTPKRARDVL